MAQGSSEARTARTLAACLLLGLVMLMPAPSVAADPLRIAILKFGFLDTSHEPGDQAAEHEARLELVAQELDRFFQASDNFEVVPLEMSCPPDDSDCIIKSARDAGAELVLAGTIHKGSSMLVQMWSGAFETRTGERLFFREMSLRGDTDASWLRGVRSLAQDLQDAQLNPAR